MQLHLHQTEITSQFQLQVKLCLSHLLKQFSNWHILHITIQMLNFLICRKAPFVHTYRLIRPTDRWCLQVGKRGLSMCAFIIQTQRGDWWCVCAAGFRSHTAELQDCGNTDRELQEGHSLWCWCSPPHRATGQNTAAALWTRCDTHAFCSSC